MKTATYGDLSAHAVAAATDGYLPVPAAYREGNVNRGEGNDDPGDLDGIEPRHVRHNKRRRRENEARREGQQASARQRMRQKGSSAWMGEGWR